MVELPIDTAAKFWPDLAPYVERALAYDLANTTSLEEIAEQVAHGYARILLASDGENVLSATVIQAYYDNENRRMLHVLATAGDNSEVWLPALINELQRIGELEACEGVTMMGRPGWARKLVKFGWRTIQVTMQLEVANGRNVEKQAKEPANERGPERERQPKPVAVPNIR